MAQEYCEGTAEILGVFLGDGWIEKGKNALFITGHPSEDKSYYDNFLAPLFSVHFAPVKPRFFPYWGVYGICAYRGSVIAAAVRLGFQRGTKTTTAQIPDGLVQSCSLHLYIAVLRGLFDADGSFWCERSNSASSCVWKRTHNYRPEMRITSCSSMLLAQAKHMLDQLEIDSKIVRKHRGGFKHRRNTKPAFALNIRRRVEIERWFEIIGTNNPKHSTRFAVWKKLGHLPPNTDIAGRMRLLEENASGL